jgi:hypothetical protein
VEAVPGSRSGQPIFNSHILRSKLNYQFNKYLTLRAIVDDYAVLSNPQLIFQDKYKRAVGDILLTYQLNAGAALYLGYTNRIENVSPERGPVDRIIQRGDLSRSTAAQVFAKVSYLIRF